MLAFPIFLGRPRIVLPQKHSGGVFPAESEDAQKRTRPKSGSYLCWHYLSFWVGQRIVLPE